MSLNNHDLLLRLLCGLPHYYLPIVCFPLQYLKLFNFALLFMKFQIMALLQTAWNIHLKAFYFVSNVLHLSLISFLDFSVIIISTISLILIVFLILVFCFKFAIHNQSTFQDAFLFIDRNFSLHYNLVWSN